MLILESLWLCILLWFDARSAPAGDREGLFYE